MADAKQALNRELFEVVAVVGLNSVTDDKGVTRNKSTISFQYPSPHEGPIVEQQINALTPFCFPDIQALTPVAQKESEYYSFVLTESDGTKRYGYVIRNLPIPENPTNPEPRLPHCICITSFLRSSGMFEQILRVIEIKYNVSPAAVTQFLTAVKEYSLPAPGESFVVRAQNAKGTHTEQFRFLRPAEDEIVFECMDYEGLVKSISTENIFYIFSSMIFERRLIFVSAKLGTLSKIVQAFVSLLYPFSWQYIFIPILPQSLLNFACAPMPFIIGVLEVHLPEIKRMESAMEECLMFDIDNDTFLKQPWDDTTRLPYKAGNTLLSELERMRKKLKKFYRTSTRGDVKTTLRTLFKEFGDYFTSFFAEVMQDYRSFIKKNETTGKMVWDREGFIASYSEAERPFAKSFSGMQFFDCFIRSRENESTDGPFDQRIAEFLLRKKESKEKEKVNLGQRFEGVKAKLKNSVKKAGEDMDATPSAEDLHSSTSDIVPSRSESEKEGESHERLKKKLSAFGDSFAPKLSALGDELRPKLISVTKMGEKFNEKFTEKFGDKFGREKNDDEEKPDKQDKQEKEKREKQNSRKSKRLSMADESGLFKNSSPESSLSTSPAMKTTRGHETKARASSAILSPKELKELHAALRSAKDRDDHPELVSPRSSHFAAPSPRTVAVKQSNLRKTDGAIGPSNPHPPIVPPLSIHAARDASSLPAPTLLPPPTPHSNSQAPSLPPPSTPAPSAPLPALPHSSVSIPNIPLPALPPTLPPPQLSPSRDYSPLPPINASLPPPAFTSPPPVPTPITLPPISSVPASVSPRASTTPSPSTSPAVARRAAPSPLARSATSQTNALADAVNCDASCRTRLILSWGTGGVCITTSFKVN